MKVHNCSTSLRKLNDGTCFWWSEHPGCLFFKLAHETAGGLIAAARLTDGSFHVLEGDTTVTPQPASVICEA